MGRTSLVLAVVAALVTVLVFTVPAFALPSENAVPPGPQPPADTQVTPDIQVPDDNANTCEGNAASGEAIDATRNEGPDLGPEAPGFHVLDTTHLTPHELLEIVC